MVLEISVSWMSAVASCTSVPAPAPGWHRSGPSCNVVTTPAGWLASIGSQPKLVGRCDVLPYTPPLDTHRHEGLHATDAGGSSSRMLSPWVITSHG